MNKHVWTLFADESGNVGNDYLNKDQPFFVSAGILVPFERLPALTEFMETEFKSEVKGSRLAKSSNGRHRVAQVLTKLKQLDIETFFIAQERSFAASGRVVDILLDPLHNDSARWLSTLALERRDAVTNSIYERLSTSTLRSFLTWLDEPDLVSFPNVVHTILNEISDLSPNLVQSIGAAGTQPALSAIVEAEQSIATNRNLYYQLNLPGFAHLTRMVDSFMSKLNKDFEICHDDSPGFEMLLKEWVELRPLSADESTMSVYSEGGRQIRLGMNRSRSFRTADSAETAGLQAADILASAVGRLLRDIHFGSDWSTSHRLISELTLDKLNEASNPPRFAGIYCSGKTKQKMARVLGRRNMV